jgi:hypothetical protein
MWPQLKARSSHYLTTHPTMVFVTCDSSGVLQLFSFWFMWPQLRARRFSSGKTNAPFSTCLIAWIPQMVVVDMSDTWWAFICLAKSSFKLFESMLWNMFFICRWRRSYIYKVILNVDWFWLWK